MENGIGKIVRMANGKGKKIAECGRGKREYEKLAKGKEEFGDWGTEERRLALSQINQHWFIPPGVHHCVIQASERTPSTRFMFEPNTSLYIYCATLEYSH